MMTCGVNRLLGDDALEQLAGLLRRHLRGDWGDVCPEDAGLNDAALSDGSRLLSAYTVRLPGARDDVKLWVITEAADENGKREATTVLLPEEY